MDLKFVMGLGKPRKGMEKQKNLSRAYKQVMRVYNPNGIQPSLTEDKRNFIVSMPTNGTNMQQKSMKKTSGKDQTQETSEQLELMKSPTTICSPLDSLAKLLALLEKEKDLTIHEALCSLKLEEYYDIKNLDILYLKMSRGCFHTMKGEPLKSSSFRLMNWGMTFNGRCITAKIGFRRTGQECSLSDILEEDVDQKYFLSETAIKRLIRRGMSSLYQEQSQQKIKVDNVTLTGVQH